MFGGTIERNDGTIAVSVSRVFALSLLVRVSAAALSVDPESSTAIRGFESVA